MLSDDIKVIDFLHRRDFFPDDNGAWGRIKTALAELGTTPNTGSPKLLAYLDNALESIRIGNISLAELNINEARKQLRAGA